MCYQFISLLFGSKAKAESKEKWNTRQQGTRLLMPTHVSQRDAFYELDESLR
jgi:hypothetical protein